MNWRRRFVFACVIALGMTPLIAQETARLQIEITRDNTSVARPELKVASGGEGRVSIGESSRDPLIKDMRETITITPTVRGDDIALAFNIDSGSRQLRPSLVISKDVKGAFEWVAADGRPVRLTVAWVQ
jgi:hypothetical protein